MTGPCANVFPFFISPVSEPSHPAECGWECSPITLVAVTTSYLVHGKKAKLLSVYLTLEAGGLPGEKVCAILGGHMVGKENEYQSACSTAGYLR